VIKNFHVGQSIELIKDGRAFDLHNCFDFKGACFVPDRGLRITFEPNLEFGVGFSTIHIEATGIDYFAVSPGFFSAQIDYLDEIGFKSPQDQNDNWLLMEGQTAQADHFFFRFSENHFIRFHALHVVLIEVGDKN